MKDYLQSFLVCLTLTILLSGFAFGQQSVENHSKLASQGGQVELPKNLLPHTTRGYYWFKSFDGGALPDRWQNVVNQGNGFIFSVNPYSHTYIYYFGDKESDARLITPLLDLGGLETATLGITHRIYVYESGWSNKVLISNDGNNWETVVNY